MGVNVMNKEIEQLLFDKGVDIVRFVDISGLPEKQTQGFDKAIVFCVALSKEFMISVHEGKEIGDDEFVTKEHETDVLADWLAAHLQQKGYKAYSQSEKNNDDHGNYNEKTKISNLPHKTIAHLAGLGYIGKNSLLITKEFGCAFSMCTVLTDAPVTTECHPITESKCGDCNDCMQACPENAIRGIDWSDNAGREAIIDVTKCIQCALKCVASCPETLKYANQ